MQRSAGPPLPRNKRSVPYTQMRLAATVGLVATGSYFLGVVAGTRLNKRPPLWVRAALALAAELPCETEEQRRERALDLAFKRFAHFLEANVVPAAEACVGGMLVGVVAACTTCLVAAAAKQEA